jgi:guanylate kinase
MHNIPGKLVVVTGFSGAGKDTLINLLLQKRNDFEVVVTHSTRPPRPGEIPGVHHHFVQEKEFKQLIQKNEMLEYVKYGSFYKGTSKGEFEKIITGKNLIWRVDIFRAAVYENTFLKVYGQEVTRQIVSNTLTVFVKAENHKIIQNRYLKRERGKANLKEFQKRLQRDIELFKKYEHAFPNIILNRSGKPEESAVEMERLVDNFLHQ